MAPRFRRKRKDSSRTGCEGACAAQILMLFLMNRPRTLVKGHIHEMASGPLMFLSTYSIICAPTSRSRRKKVSSQKIFTMVFTRLQRWNRLTSMAVPTSGCSSANSTSSSFFCFCFLPLFLPLASIGVAFLSFPAWWRKAPSRFLTDHSMTSEKMFSSSISSLLLPPFFGFDFFGFFTSSPASPFFCAALSSLAFRSSSAAFQEASLDSVWWLSIDRTAVW
mmetsp:Transcript_124600/g.363822  ORF Transcript_124600/g.363822 Transcript_124600/m.363822 type:complete len:221 (+) Transcript_124600:1448-2110(+)